MNDHDLAARLRDGLADLAAAAGDPPDFPGDVVADGRADRPMWRYALAVAAVLALVVGGLVVLTRTGADPVAEGPPGSAPLFGTRWYLESATIDGEPVLIRPDRIPWVFGEDNQCTFGGPDCPSGPVLIGEDGCNHFERSIAFDGDRATWGTWNMSTLAACVGGPPSVFDRVMKAAGFTYAIDGDTLRVAEDGVELVFRVGDPLGEPAGFVLLEGRDGDIAYRVTWNGAVNIEWVDTSTASMVNRQGYAAVGDTLSATFVDLGSSRLLFAILPDAAAGARYIGADGDTSALTVVPRGDAPVNVAQGTFDADPGPGRLVAYDASGTELAAIEMRGADQGGITSIPPTVTTAPNAPSTPPPTSPSPAGDLPLYETAWALTEAILDGRSVTTAGTNIDPVTWVLHESWPCASQIEGCAPGPVLIERDGCNENERDLNVQDGSVTWLSWVGTAVGCGGDDVTDAYNALMEADGFTFTISGSTLTIESDGNVFVFTGTPVDPPPPTAAPPVTCGAEPGSPTDLTAEPKDWLLNGDYHRWADSDGCPVRIDVISQNAGPEHCGWESVTFLSIGDPLGASIATERPGRRFAWDPDNVLVGDPAYAGATIATADLPATAADTGYRDGDSQLWLDDADPSVLYRVHGATADRFAATEAACD